jgi:hypothetical protein
MTSAAGGRSLMDLSGPLGPNGGELLSKLMLRSPFSMLLKLNLRYAQAVLHPDG